MEMENRLLNNETSESESDIDDSDSEFDKTKNSPNSLELITRKNDIKNNRNLDENDKNIMFKLFNRERTGYFSDNLSMKFNERAFNKVPTRLSFCLKDIVPYCYLQGHMFMGLTICGQFLLSYKVCYNENSVANNYNFCTYYKYTLYFWIYRPHQPLSKYFKICMFDDHGVDNLKGVTMTQWLTKPNLLIIHGASEYENEDSYLTILRVPKLGCLECKKLHDIDGDGFFRVDALCIKCNLTIHSKYSATESDPKFNPNINLICPEHIILIANGFIHTLNVELEMIAKQQFQHNNSTAHSVVIHEKWFPTSSIGVFDKNKNIGNNANETNNYLTEEQKKCDNKNTIVARILADFTDLESESLIPEKSLIEKNKKNYDDLIFSCGLANSLKEPTKILKNDTKSSTQSKVNLLNHSGTKRNSRIVTKTFRNGVTTTDLQQPSSSTPSTSKSTLAANAYDFSEEDTTEKCEKIATFRKRRLADKKYEFSEDNSENIIPFRKTRFSTGGSVLNAMTPTRRYQRPASHYHATGSGTVFLSTQSSQSFENTTHLHRASPSQGFRSPCGSPVGSSTNNQNSSINSGPNSPSLNTNQGRHLRSPVKGQQSQQNHQQFLCKSPPSASSLLSPNSSNTQLLSPTIKPLNTLSPIQISVAKRTHFDQLNGNSSPNSTASGTENQSPLYYGNYQPFLSPRRDEKVFEVPVGGVIELPEKPICSKKFQRRYVEENDAASVITSEEDDCISPGYHTLLPLEVHGSCYSDMQMISQSSYQQLRCHTVVITQNSFDLETFTYYVISNLCQQNNKMYDVFYDWACELVNVCPRTYTICCMLMAHFTARDQLSTSTLNSNSPTSTLSKKCLNCTRNIDCVFHRKQYECRILFSWNLKSGDWNILDYGQLTEVKKSTSHTSVKFMKNSGLTQQAKLIAKEISDNLNQTHSYEFNLRVLDSNIDKSKNSLIDLDNMIEFYRKKPKMQLLPLSAPSSDDSISDY